MHSTAQAATGTLTSKAVSLEIACTPSFVTPPHPHMHSFLRFGSHSPAASRQVPVMLRQRDNGEIENWSSVIRWRREGEKRERERRKRCTCESEASGK